MIRILNFYSIAILIFMLPFQTVSQEEQHTHSEDEGHSNDTFVAVSQEQTASASENEEEHADAITEVIPEKDAVPASSKSVFASLSRFPNLHPFVVHFPIVLLLLAFLSQLLGLIFLREKFSWITLFMLLAGFIGALLAAQVFHAHVGDVPQNISEVFETHEYYGKTTTWLAGIALVLKLVSHFLLKRKTWAEIIVFLVISGSALTVSLAGHLGAQLVHIENVGPQGNYLEEHEHDE